MNLNQLVTILEIEGEQGLEKLTVEPVLEMHGSFQILMKSLKESQAYGLGLFDVSFTEHGGVSFTEVQRETPTFQFTHELIPLREGEKEQLISSCVGKTISFARFDFTAIDETLHIEFTDGSKLTLQGGSSSGYGVIAMYKQG